MEPLAPITFEPSGATVWVERGTTVLEAARKAGVVIEATCGGRGTCGSCGVRVRRGALEPAAAEEADALSSVGAQIRLACRARVIGPVTVEPVVAVSPVPHATPADATEGVPLVAAVDLGTTTVAVAVVNPVTSTELGRSLVANRQRAFGADVLTRLSAALAGHATELQRLAQESIKEAIEAAIGAEMAARVIRVTVAGNTVMTALFTGADVSSLATHPFSTPVDCDRVVDAGVLRATLAAGARIDVVPPIGGFVGGDLVAGVTALGLLDGPPSLLVDVGTNAEVALAMGGRLWVASAAAGPAFEGGGIASGGAAVSGAVTGVDVTETGEIELTVIGREEPTWFSGAGLLSALAALVRSGHVDASGHLSADGPLSARFTRDARGVLGVGLGDHPGLLVIDQLDIRALQLAKAAVRAAIESVLDEAAVHAGDLDTVFVAGAFGAALSEADVVDLGLVPYEALGKVMAGGNTSLAGAVAIALAGTDHAASRVIRSAHHVDLAGRDGFNDLLMRAVSLERYSA